MRVMLLLKYKVVVTMATTDFLAAGHKNKNDIVGFYRDLSVCNVSS